MAYNKSESICIYGNQNICKIDLCIAIPTYQRINSLRKILKSINEQKNPHKIKYKIMIVSNDPEFDIEAISDLLIEKKYIVYRNKVNLGMCGNMNQCVKLSFGKYLAFVQDDDMLLPNYLSEVGKIISEGIIDEYSCIIPNRYFLIDDNSHSKKFGRKSIIIMQLKKLLSDIVSFFKTKNIIQIVKPLDCIESLYNVFGGGPTCGILFNRETLLASELFNKNYPYIFDYIFFMHFAEANKVALYDKYLAIYVTAQSATNRIDVQYDFFRGKYDFLRENMHKYSYINQNFDCLVYSFYSGYPQEVQKEIEENYNIKKVNKIEYCLISIRSFFYLLSIHGYRRANCPKKIKKWYDNL